MTHDPTGNIARHVNRAREDEVYSSDPMLDRYIRARAKLYRRAIRRALAGIEEARPKFMFGMAAQARVVRAFRRRMARER